ncbi:MAG TPA: endonuclease/exonuclease/phosphatase family protein [Acidimicrobiales bacterium]|nr:endonuclease/exonuclease/phosphatase family protein [Acidimicrobiales bacterium]
MHRPGNEIVVASFNTHAGVDGWGRPYDVVASCAALDADVLVLQEVWWPDDGDGLAEQVAAALGYEAVTRQLASGRRAGPDESADDRWMPRLGLGSAGHALYLDSERPLGQRTLESERYRSARPGRWGLAVLTRLGLSGHRVVDLGRLRQDRVRRAAVVVDVETPEGPLTVVGVHMPHLTAGSPRQFARLRDALDAEGASVVAGDMNLWGPPVEMLLGGWRRAVRGRTWPAWRPHSQVDHILVRGDVAERQAGVAPPAGSDHRPVVARLALGAPATPTPRPGGSRRSERSK